MLLDVKKIHSYYAKSHILQGVSMHLAEGDIVCLLGRNGVGKTTTLKSIMGIVQAHEGSILLRGNELIGKPPYEIAHMGVGYVPEDRRIFPSLTANENLLMGIKKEKNGTSSTKAWTIEKVYDSFPQLHERKNSKGGHLSGGEQQMLTVARTLMGNPELILVDEPTEGLAPLIAKSVLEMLSTVSGSGVSILLVEQNFKAATTLADRFYIMSKGQIVFDGDGAALQAAEDIRKSYLEV
jgi:branched-chain amino acid transport system ATP-binding protein